MPLELCRRLDGFRSREAIEYFVRYAKTVLTRYHDRVKYWLTFNEINVTLISPLLGAGVMTPKSKLTAQDKYQGCPPSAGGQCTCDAVCTPAGRHPENRLHGSFGTALSNDLQSG